MKATMKARAVIGRRIVAVEQISMFEQPPEYACLLADPPWAERGGGKIKRGADRHYDLAGKLGDIRPILRAIRDSGSFTPAPNAHLWCWYTDTFLEDALTLVRELGFRYVRTFVWVKTGGEHDNEAVAAARREVLDAAVEAAAEGMLASGRDHHGRTETMSSRFCEAMSALSVASRHVEQTDDDLRMGIGQYGRGCHEGMIFAVRGQGQDKSVWTGDRSVRSCFHAPHPTDEHGKRIHSRKPPRSYELIERVSKGPRVELFARVAQPGWSVWGNQAPSVEGDSIVEATQRALERQRREAGLDD